MARDKIMIVAGVGFRAAATASDLVAIVRRAQRESHREAGGIAAPSFKTPHEGLLAAVTILGLPLIVIDSARLEAVQGRCITRSVHAAQATSFASIAEASALAALNDGATLILSRIADARATCALAFGDRR